MTPMIIDVYEVISLVKQARPSCFTVLGGPHVTSFGAESLCRPEIDFGVMGYGEYSFLCLLEALFGQGVLARVPGLIYRDGGKTVSVPVQNDVITLDELPIPDRSFVDYRKYRCPVGTKDIMATVVSSRGCPFNCTFCNSPDKAYKPRSLANVIEEIRYLQGLGIQEVFFFDDLFSVNRRRIIEFCQTLERQQLKIRWAFKARVNGLDEETMLAIKKSGCERIHFGIETHTNESLKNLKKGITIEQIRRAVNLCYRHKINSVGSFMINLPGDTEQTILDRFKFANSLKLDYCQYAILVAYNHSEIFNQGAKIGWWPKGLWLDYIRNPKKDFVAPIINNGISRPRLDQLLSQGLRSFYFRPRYILQRLRNLHGAAELKKYARGAIKLLSFRAPSNKSL